MTIGFATAIPAARAAAKRPVEPLAKARAWRILAWLAWLILLTGFTPILTWNTFAQEAAPTPGSPADGTVRRADENEVTNYRIRAGDTLEIRVYQEDELNTKARVDEEGGLVLPLIGRVSVLGLTSEAARRLVTERYHNEYVINPQITLAVAEFAPRRFSVMGQVVKPGVYEIPSREKVNLLQAIAMAGGYTKIADPSKVRIRRVTDKGEEILRFNAKALATGTASEIPLIQGDDNLTVGESAF